MLNLIGPVDDQFAIFAYTSGDDSYQVIIFPETVQCGQEIIISAARLEKFLQQRLQKSHAADARESGDIFIHSLTADEIFELTGIQVSSPGAENASYAA